MTQDPRMKIIYDFNVGENYACDGIEQYARPIFDGDNEVHYGFGFEYDDLEHLFIDGAECFCTCDTRGEVFIVPLLPVRPQGRRIR